MIKKRLSQELESQQLTTKLQVSFAKIIRHEELETRKQDHLPSGHIMESYENSKGKTG